MIRTLSDSIDRKDSAIWVFFALCCLGKIPGGAPFSQLHKGGKKDSAIWGGSHANSVTLGVTRFYKRFSPFPPLFTTDSSASRTAWKCVFPTT